MPAPSIKSGTGHSLIIDYSASPTTPTLDSNSTSKGNNANSNIGSHATGSTYNTFIASGAVASTRYGGLHAATTFSASAEGTLVLFHQRISSPQHKYQIETVANAGLTLTMKSSSGNYRRWVIDGTNSTNPLYDYNAILIDPRHTASEYASAGTFDTTKISSFELHIAHSSIGSTGRTVEAGSAWLVTPYTIVNGTSGDPGKFTTATASAQASYLRNVKQTGSSTFEIGFGITIGDGGTTSTYFSDSNKTLLFPSTTGGGLDRRFHFPNGHIGLKVSGGASATTYVNASGITVIGPHYLDLTPHTSVDTCAWSNCTFSGVTRFTLNANVDFTSCSFTSCVTLPVHTADFAGTTTVSSTTGSYTIDATGLLTIEDFALTAASTEYGVYTNPTSGQTLTFDGVTWSGYGAGKKVYIDLGAGSVTVNSGGLLATVDVTAAGAITINFDQTTTTIKHLTLTNGARYQLYNVTKSTQLANSTAGASGFTYTTTGTASVADGDTIRLRATYINGATSWSSLEATGTATAGGTLDFGANSLSADSTYASYAIDGSAVTEFSTDYVDVECDVDDPDHQTTKKRLYAWLRYVQTTSDGIANWWGAVTALDDANIKINASVVDLTIENNGTQVVRFTDTDLYMYRDDGASIASSSGQGIIWESGKVYIAETGVSGLTSAESALLSGASTSTQVAAMASKLTYTIAMSAAGVVHTDIKAVKGLTIGGTGTASDPWGPA